ncbi:hypothetical protein X777_02918 [Ooceraea biroi]|uniref:Uncharacterized protein n=1 Tax=Ooceraea biroi TaxID=2015173 RepID=A0A026WMF5_OOCBI|nr:hypothetical protein X777_02918 [Ooceraea biroi]
MQFRGTSNVANSRGFGDTFSHNVRNMRAFQHHGARTEISWGDIPPQLDSGLD